MTEPTDAIRDAEWITQKLRFDRPFINSPRPQDSDGVSAFRGRVSPEEAYRRVVKSGAPDENDGVRYARARKLRAEGFEVTPSPNQRNPNHVSITYQGDWDNSAARKFVSCFTEILWYQRGEEQQ